MGVLLPGATQGEGIREIENPAGDVPRTVAGFDDSPYAVNARFGTEEPENAEHNVIRVSK